LGLLGGEAGCLEVRKSLADEDSRVRAAAAEALGDCGEPTSVPALLALLLDDDETVVQAAARGLGQIRDDTGARALAAALVRPGQSLLTQRALAAALARAPHPEAQAALLEALGNSDPQVRGYAAEALGHVGDEEAWSALVGLKDDAAPLLKGSVGDAASAAIVLLERRGRSAAPVAQTDSLPPTEKEDSE
jgi:HEAT repeat protein